MAQITRHGKKRAKERAGISKGNMQKMASKILREGVTHKECSGDLERWVTSKYFKNRTANNIRLYGNQCYIFRNETLITVLQIPENLVAEVARIRKERTTKVKYRINRRDSIMVHGLQLSRIIAERNFADVHTGDLGGYIMNTHNLSHDGNCWIYDDACVYGKAVVKENASVQDTASIDGHAVITDDAVIMDQSVIQGNAIVSGQITLAGNSQVRGDAHVYGDGKITDLICDSGIHEFSYAATACNPPIPISSQDDRIQHLMEVGFCRNEQEAQLLDDWLRLH